MNLKPVKRNQTTAMTKNKNIQKIDARNTHQKTQKSPSNPMGFFIQSFETGKEVTYPMCNPPFTEKSAPVLKPPSSEASHAIIDAISSGLPKRLTGMP